MAGSSTIYDNITDTSFEVFLDRLWYHSNGMLYFCGNTLFLHLHGHLESTTPMLEDISNQDPILQQFLQPSTVAHQGFDLILVNWISYEKLGAIHKELTTIPSKLLVKYPHSYAQHLPCQCVHYHPTFLQKHPFSFRYNSFSLINCAPKEDPALTEDEVLTINMDTPVV